MAVNTNEYEKSNALQIFPNPAQNEFTIYSEIQGLSNVKVTDILGETVYQQNNVQLNNSPIIPTDGMIPGMYLVHIYYNDTWIIKKLIIR